MSELSLATKGGTEPTQGAVSFLSFILHLLLITSMIFCDTFPATYLKCASNCGYLKQANSY